jgi:hypothetical protein
MTDKLKIVFAPNSFDDFDGSQEELDEIVNGIMEYLQSAEFLEQLEDAKEGLIESEFFDGDEISRVLNSKNSPTIH